VRNVIAFGFLVAVIAAGCGEDKKAVIPTKLDNPLPKVATSGGGGDPGAGKAKGPGGSSKAD
jgi:hypothetical protein